MPRIELSDEELLEEFQSRGDQEFLGKLFNRYMELVFGVCLKYLKNSSDAKDATMSIYELISTKLKTQQIENFKGWLFTVSKNYCLEQLRKSKGTLTKEKEFKIVQSEGYFHPDEVDQKEKKLTILEGCIEKLPQQQKNMIDLFYFKKKSYQEIVETEGLSWNMVRSNIQNGRRNLKQCIESHGS